MSICWNEMLKLLSSLQACYLLSKNYQEKLIVKIKTIAAAFDYKKVIVT